MEKKLSVIVPVYNARKHLRQTIDSLIDQTYKNLEIILVNDCSTDKSLDICMDFVYKDPRVRVVNHDVNKGTGGARKSGVLSATGEYIGWVDSDDRHDRHMFEDLIKILEENDADIIQCKYFFEFDDKILRTKDTGSVTKLSNIEAVESLFNLGVIDTIYWNKVFRKHLFEDVEMSLRRYGLEDTDTVYKLLFNARSVLFYDKSYCYYRQHPGTHTSGALSIDKAMQSIEVDANKDEYFKQRCPRLQTLCKRKLFTKHISVFYSLDGNEDGCENYRRKIASEAKKLYNLIKNTLNLKKRCFYAVLLFGTKNNILSKILFSLIRLQYKRKGYRLDRATGKWKIIRE